MRKSNAAALILVGVMVLVSSSCGSKKDANKINFKEAIQAELDRQPACIPIRTPHDVPSWNGRFRTDEQLEALAQAGLVKRSQMMVPRAGMDLLTLDDRRPKEVPGYRYELADAAKKYMVKVRTAMGEVDQLCYGKKTVADVVRFTVPAPAMGMTVSEATYTWKLTDIAEWARNRGTCPWPVTDVVNPNA